MKRVLIAALIASIIALPSNHAEAKTITLRCSGLVTRNVASGTLSSLYSDKTGGELKFDATIVDELRFFLNGELNGSVLSTPTYYKLESSYEPVGLLTSMNWLILINRENGKFEFTYIHSILKPGTPELEFLGIAQTDASGDCELAQPLPKF